MAEKKEEMKVDKVTGEVTEPKNMFDPYSDKRADINSDSDKITKEAADGLNTVDQSGYNYDPFAERRALENSDEMRSESDKRIYKVPAMVMRYAGSVREGRKMYSYATGYKRVVNGKAIAQTIDLEPMVKRQDTYDLLDAIFGESNSLPLEIVRTTVTTTVNNRTKSTHNYAFRVSATDEDGVEVVCTLVPTRGNNDKKDNLLAKMRKDGKIDY